MVCVVWNNKLTKNQSAKSWIISFIMTTSYYKSIIMNPDKTPMNVNDQRSETIEDIWDQDHVVKWVLQQVVHKVLQC